MKMTIVRSKPKKSTGVVLYDTNFNNKKNAQNNFLLKEKKTMLGLTPNLSSDSTRLHIKKYL